ncbi:MAG: aminotransferase class V-fold PLP-dependent enzyme, partial [Myxococcota bacterium]
MIPGPIEVSEAVISAYSIRPPSHVAPTFIEQFGIAVERMREVWLATAESQPFIVPGSGTMAMEMAATNLVEPGEDVLVVNAGYFGDRMADMLRRRGAVIHQVRAEIGAVPSLDEVAQALDETKARVLFATHVDTSTGVKVDAEGLTRLARERDILCAFDGVCATAAEPFAMGEWDADCYLTGSQKAIGLPAGLGLMVASPRALQKREKLEREPPMVLDWFKWLPIMRAYEERKGSYFATPATSLVPALTTALGELVDDRDGELTGIRATFARHRRVAQSCRDAWARMGLSLVAADPGTAGNT